MRNEGLFDEEKIRKAIAQLIPAGCVFEIRILQGSKKNAISGYFTDANLVINAFQNGNVDLRNSNVYITLQQLKSACINKPQGNRFIAGAKSSSDDVVNNYNWLFVDIDPERLADIPSSNEELNESYNVAKRVIQYMRGLGFSEPVKAISGNGSHLLYRIALDNTLENAELIKKCLTALSQMFSNEYVKIDEVNFNPSRICKLYGTLAQKGSESQDRPFRMSKLIGDIFHPVVNPKELLEKLASQIVVEETDLKSAPTRHNQQEEFDIERWMQEHGLRYKEAKWKNGRRFVLDECPFNHEHTAPDSAIFVASNGAIGFRCLHNSCFGKKWQDVRLMFEPNAYDKQLYEIDDHIALGMAKHNKDREWEKHPFIDEPVFYNASDVEAIDEANHEYIATGIKLLDENINGLEKTSLSVLSGLRGAAKSTILSQIMIKAVEDGHNVLCYSGELNPKRFMHWLYLQSAGAEHIQQGQKFKNAYELDCTATKDAITKWLGNHLWLYNNNHGNDFSKIYDELCKGIEKLKCDLVVIDNLMALNLQNLTTGNDKYDNQTEFVWKLKELANKYNVHIIFVAHPKKASGFLRLDDISGSGNISNIVDNAFIIHRNNADFQRLTKQMFNWSADNEAYTGSNIIEICKDRQYGTQDLFIPLHYDTKSKRLKNDISERIVYSWTRYMNDEAEELF